MGYGGSSRGRWQKVIDARRLSREALGWTTEQPGLFDRPPKPRSRTSPPPFPAEPPQRSEAIGVLTLGETAARLGVTRKELEAMIASGTIASFETGFTRTIPSAEIDRILAARQ